MSMIFNDNLTQKQSSIWHNLKLNCDRKVLIVINLPLYVCREESRKWTCQTNLRMKICSVLRPILVLSKKFSPLIVVKTGQARIVCWRCPGNWFLRQLKVVPWEKMKWRQHCFKTNISYTVVIIMLLQNTNNLFLMR